MPVFSPNVSRGKGGAAQIPVHLGLANEAGHPRQGRIEFIDNQLDPHSGTIRVRALFDNRDGQLTPGLFARRRSEAAARCRRC